VPRRVPRGVTISLASLADDMRVHEHVARAAPRAAVDQQRALQRRIRRLDRREKLLRGEGRGVSD